MYLLSLTTLTLASSFIVPSFAAPTSDNNNNNKALVDVPAALAIVQQLYADVKHKKLLARRPGNHHIPTFAPRLDRLRLDQEKDLAAKAKASKTCTAAMASINTLVVDATASIISLSVGSSPLTNKRAFFLESSMDDDALAKKQIIINPAGPYRSGDDCNLDPSEDQRRVE
ncbi:MAG: hypothetical protein Q9207_005207 [Kuettlingeria erythrocarpa]